MATYKLIGKRFLRKYTEPGTSPVYAAAVQAQRVVDSFCDVPWEPVKPSAATMTHHTDEVVDEADGTTGLDKNVAIRDQFDAALFCAGHSGGQHRAYANAACYRYTMPDEAVGATLTTFSAQITSDPYNSAGARIHIFTNATGEIPTNCRDCRGEDAGGDVVEDGTTAAGAAKRTVRTVSNTDYWYPTTETVTLSPTGGLALQKYLFVVVALESYSTVRGNWMEGCSFMENKASITTSAFVDGWSDGDTIDLSFDESGETAFPVLSGGVLPCAGGGSPSGERHVAVRADANLIVEADGSQTPVQDADGVAAASALSRAYAMFYTGSGDMSAPGEHSRAAGASFNVTRAVEPLPTAGSDEPQPTDIVRIDAAALVVPFAWPAAPSKIRLSFAEPSLPSGARFNVFLASATEYLPSLTEEQLKSPGLWDGGDGAPFVLLGTIDGGTSAEFDVPSETGRAGTLVLTAWLPPEAYSLAEGGTKGTGQAFLPDITIVSVK